MRTPGLPPLFLLALVACSSPETKPGPAPLPQQLAAAAVTPLNDLNLLHTKIPAVLLAAQKGPYAPPPDPTCEGLRSEVRQLDAALGEDVDVPQEPGGPSLVERGRADLHEAAVGAVRSNAETLIPFRAWVRKLTGAERASRQVTRAIAAGIVRRSYLKGLGEARGCQPPASPLHPLEGPAAPPADPTVTTAPH